MRPEDEPWKFGDQTLAVKATIVVIVAFLAVIGLAALGALAGLAVRVCVAVWAGV